MDSFTACDRFFGNDGSELMKSMSFWPKKVNNFLHGEMFILNHLVFQQDDALFRVNCLQR
jgi:hypothetical protein